jgi:hypothetical protein
MAIGRIVKVAGPLVVAEGLTDKGILLGPFKRRRSSCIRS